MNIVIGSYVKSLVRINSYVSEGSCGKVYEVCGDEFFVRWEGGDYTYARGADLELVSQEDIEKLFGLDPEALKKPFIYMEVMRDDESRGLNLGEVYIPTYKHTYSSGDTEVSFRSKGDRYCCWFSNRINTNFKAVGSDVERTDLYPKVLLDWGFEYAMVKNYGDHSGQVRDFFYSFFNDEIKKFQMGWMRIDVFRPEPSKSVRGAISIFQNKTKKDRDVKTPYSKVGRAFRAMFPEATDAQIEKWADKYREVYPTNDYVLKSGTERADFKKAYAGDQVPCQNPYTTSSRKSLANSCMRYDFDNLPCHPTETYASGDFRIYWTETAKGLVGSRCVVHTPADGKPQAGPIYGVCEHSINLIENALKDADADLYGSSCWKGAKLVHKPHNGGVIGPYIDGNYQNLRESNCGEFLIICDGGRNTYEASNYSGILGVEDCVSCTECDADVDDEDVFNDPEGNCLCESCYNENWRYCDEYNQTMPLEGGAIAYHRLGRGNYWFSHWVCEEALTEYYTYCEDEGEWFRHEFVVEDADGDYVSLRAINEGTYGINAEDELAYPMDQLAQDKDGRLVTITWLEENGYQLNEAGEYEQKEAA